MTISHRIAKITDLTILLEFVKEFHKAEHLPFNQQADEDALKRILTDESLGQVLLIQKDEVTIGYLILTLGYSIEYRGRDAFIDEFYLRSDYRGQGIGTKTLAFIEQAARTLGVQALHLEVDFDNADAQRLYHKVGYQSHDRFLMTKWLTTPISNIVGE